VKLRILDFAEADLQAGFRFYERQSLGIGTYFLETLYLRGRSESVAVQGRDEVPPGTCLTKRHVCN
jgi:hypothetical protein